jgi:3D (Asp-Asp-Asp) domain-containing protein
MRRTLGVLILAFLIISFNLATPVATQIDVSQGIVRNVTAYNVGDPKQTDSRPCVGASGDNLCNLVKRGVNVCAANFVPLGSKLYVDKIGECIVLDKMKARFGNRVDLAMKKSEYDRAVKFGVQRLNVTKVGNGKKN